MTSEGFAGAAVDINDVRKILLAMPQVQESTIHGAPSFKLKGKLLACPALHKSAEPDSLAVRIDLDTRAKLIAAEPSTYYITEHYVNHPMVLARLAALDAKSIATLLEASWQFVSAKKRRGKRASEGE